MERGANDEYRVWSFLGMVGHIIHETSFFTQRGHEIKDEYNPTGQRTAGMLSSSRLRVHGQTPLNFVHVFIGGMRRLVDYRWKGAARGVEGKSWRLDGRKWERTHTDLQWRVRP